MTMPMLETDILAQLVRARHACLTLLRDMGRRQLELIEQRNTTALLDVLAAKQRPLTDIQRIERALEPYREQTPEARQWRNPADRAVCARQIEECNAMLREIITQERRCELSMTEQRDDLAVRLQRMRVAGQAHGAYAAASHVEVSQLDLSSER